MIATRMNGLLYSGWGPSIPRGEQSMVFQSPSDSFLNTPPTSPHLLWRIRETIQSRFVWVTEEL